MTTLRQRMVEELQRRNYSPAIASDLAKGLRNSSIKNHLWCQFTAKWHSPSRASHVDFETRYNRTRVMTSWAFDSRQVFGRRLLVVAAERTGCANGGAVALRQKK